MKQTDLVIKQHTDGEILDPTTGLYVNLFNIKPSKEYIDFMESLERGDHLNLGILPL